MNLKISVNICCYNSEKFITETLKSVLDQTFDNFEVIIVDDGSKDRTGEIIKKFDDPRIKYFYQQNRGLSASRNRAIELSSGEYIAFLDHDDIWLPDKLKKQLALFDKHPALGLVYSDCYVYNVNNKIKLKHSDLTKLFRGNVIDELFVGDFIPLLTATIPRRVVDSIGVFDRKYRIAEDYDYFIRVAKEYMIDYVPEPLAIYLVHAGNTVKQQKTCFLEELYILHEHKNYFGGVEEQIFNKRFWDLHYMIASVLLLEEKPSQARHELTKVKRKVSFKHIMWFILTYIPPWLRSRLLHFKNKRKGNSKVFE